MLENYLPILMFMIVGVALGVAAPTIGYLLGPKKSYREKNSAYECGFEPFSEAQLPFDVRYYLVAMLFLVFDVETVFLFPWAIIYDKLAVFGLIEILVFLGILIVGYYYAWKKGALEWV